MAWREQLRTGASFRGVQFSTVSAELSVGRRNVVHEFPLRDDVVVEDLGRSSRNIQVDAYVVGEDYLDDRDALLDALEAPGAGELVHPRYGVLNVAVVGVAAVRESSREGGIAHFSITFVLAGSNVFPKTRDNTANGVADAADRADQAAEDAYAAEAVTDGPQVMADEGVAGFKSRLTAVLAMARQATDTTVLADLVRGVASITGGLTALIRTPVVLVQRLASLQQQLAAAINRPLWAFQELQSLFETDRRTNVTARPGSTRAKLVANDQARRDLSRRMALPQQARMLAVAITAGTNAVASGLQLEPGVGVTTAPLALALRDALLLQLDAELEGTDPPAAVVRALSDLRAAVVRDVAMRAEFLRQRSTFPTQALLPALVLAHRIYQDADRADELVARNAVAHPLFVPAGELEVLQ